MVKLSKDSFYTYSLLGCLAPGILVTFIYFCCYFTLRSIMKKKTGKGWIQTKRISKKVEEDLKDLYENVTQHYAKGEKYRGHSEGEIRNRAIKKLCKDKIENMDANQCLDVLKHIESFKNWRWEELFEEYLDCLKVGLKTKIGEMDT